MKVRDDHLYHGAALIQIAEDEQFTAINSLRIKNQIVSSAYKINDQIAVYFKYAGAAHGASDEFVFTFHSDHIKTIRAIAATNERTFVALVCVEAREICAIIADQLASMIAARQKAKGGTEDQYTVLVTAPKGKGLRVYMNHPGTKATILGKPVIVSRSSFPSVLFG
ncbi:hypothetical protein [Dokdonella soli]|uniref:Uncharacterized protein n=1 Tax=Dokdonella soli TaxID=529810 RepID=A0ABN1IFJ1_9GAMM